MAGLIAKAETAQDIAAAFNKFLEPVSDSSTEITGLIAELFAISSAARELSNACLDPRYRGRNLLVEEDTRTVLLSIEYTFNDINRLFGDLDRPVYITNREAYRGVWKSIINHFQDESSGPLVQRLESYRRFLLDLAETIQGSVYLERIIIDHTFHHLTGVTDSARGEGLPNYDIASKSYYESRAQGWSPGLQTCRLEVLVCANPSCTLNS